MSKTQLLFNLLVDTIFHLNELQKTYYEKLSFLLAETSFSFGIKPLMETNELMIKELENLNFYEFGYIYFETHKLTDFAKSELLKEMYFSIENNKNRYQSPILQEKDLLKLYLKLLKFLYNEEKKYEEIIQFFLKEESHSFGFKPIDDAITFIEKSLGRIYTIDGSDDWIEWFCFYNEFGIKKESIIIDDFNKLIDNEDTFIEFLMSF